MTEERRKNKATTVYEDEDDEFAGHVKKYKIIINL